MKSNQLLRIVIPLILLLGGATGFIVATLGNQQANTSTDSIQETDMYEDVAFSMSMWISSIDGESNHPTRANSIDIIAYSHSMTSPDWQTIMRSAGSASAQHAPLRITKAIDKATPMLYKACYEGTSISSVILCFYHEPANLRYLNITIQTVMVISIQNYGLGEGRPTETVSFGYKEIKWIYTEYDLEGKPKGPIEVNDTWIDV